MIIISVPIVIRRLENENGLAERAEALCLAADFARNVPGGWYLRRTHIDHDFLDGPLHEFLFAPREWRYVVGQDETGQSAPPGAMVEPSFDALMTRVSHMFARGH